MSISLTYYLQPHHLGISQHMPLQESSCDADAYAYGDDASHAPLYSFS